jgi:hypothetical protein
MNLIVSSGGMRPASRLPSSPACACKPGVTAPGLHPHGSAAVRVPVPAEDCPRGGIRTARFPSICAVGDSRAIMSRGAPMRSFCASALIGSAALSARSLGGHAHPRVEAVTGPWPVCYSSPCGSARDAKIGAVAGGGPLGGTIGYRCRCGCSVSAAVAWAIGIYQA